ncbi:hypothetical protein AOA12_14970 [Microbacterium sp. No. 7]|nr:hypothetical protein AOA12_14970 [Microbacterium sp. No. 7]
MACVLRGPQAITLVSFVLWPTGYVSSEANTAVLITLIVFGAFMTFNIGGNDVADSLGISVGAGTLTMKQALVIAAIIDMLKTGEIGESASAPPAAMVALVVGMRPIALAWIITLPVAAIIGAVGYVVLSAVF